MRERYKEGSRRTAMNILSVIEKLKAGNEAVLVFPHRSVDGDCVGSSTGIVSIFRSLGVDAYVAIPEALPENMEFLGIGEYLFRPDGDTDEAGEFASRRTIHGRRVGAVVATDISDSSRMGISGADNMWIDPDCSSASEMVYYVALQIADIKGMDIKEVLAPNAAKAVLAGIVTDTGRFTFTNTHPETLETAGALMDLGGNISQVCYNLFDRKSKPKFCLSAKARSEVRFFCDDKFALTVVPYSQFVECGAGPDGVDDVVSAMRDIDGVELAIVLRELENGEIRGNVRSQEYFDCSTFAAGFGGGGHVRAAGFNASGDINELAEEVIKRVQATL